MLLTISGPQRFFYTKLVIRTTIKLKNLGTVGLNSKIAQ